MKSRITHVAPVQAAKMFAAFSFLATLPFLLLMVIPMVAMPAQARPYMTPYLLLVPFFYALGAFLFGALGAWLYNIVAKFVGGLEVTSVDVDAG
jgi:hypothetical protein